MLTARQIEDRRGWVGASDAAAILGINPYSNAHDVYLEKTGRCTPPQNKAMDAGSRFEGVIMDWAEDELGAMERDVLFEAPCGCPIKARLDGMLLRGREPVEGKTAGLFGPIPRGTWGDEGSDIVPAWYIVQVQVQMLCSDGYMGHIAAFLGGLSPEDQRILGFGDKSHYIHAFQRRLRFPRLHRLFESCWGLRLRTDDLIGRVRARRGFSMTC